MITNSPWGTITKVHTIGDHEIIEYVVGADWSDAGETHFQSLAASCSHDTLDQALLFALCWKAEPGNYDMHNYVQRLINGGPK